MRGDLDRRVHELLDRGAGLDEDELARLVGDDREARAEAIELGRIDGLLRAFPAVSRADDAWEALAVRVEQRLGEALPPGEDPTVAPVFELDPSEPRDPLSGQFSLQNLANLRTAPEDDIALLPLEGPPPPPRRAAPAGDRFSMSDVVSDVIRRPVGPPPELPSFRPPPSAAAPAPRRSRGVWLAGGLSAAAALALVTFMVTTGEDDLESLAAAPGAAESSPALPSGVQAEPSEMAAQEGRAAGDPAAARPGLLEAEAESAGGAAGGPPSAEPGPGSAAELGGVHPSAARPRAGTSPAATQDLPAGQPEQSPAREEHRRARGSPTTRGVAATAGGGGDLAEAPSRDQVLAAMRAVEPGVQACRGARRGVATVEVTVGSSGRVRSAVVVGDLAGTPEGSCIARAVRSARFPEFRQESFRVAYPFRL